MLPVAALWGFRDRAQLERSGAKHLIAEPAALLDVLGG
jgi:phosphoglycolate phosphatase-like HAD superfamily hydrolase